ncbi:MULTISPECIES: Gfo/Idh/MocA family protein [unclassified Micromonospora]|uniref:Gfo/Idh/MocA family protein n=1 Tax=unclassified Micromonospora TaxID=2617518 RepID=UPI003A850C4B
MTQHSPLRVGVVGLGRSGHGLHLATIRKLPHLFQVVAVADADPQRCQDTARELGCRAYDGVDALAAADLDLVVVATPSNQHLAHTCAALAAGRHVLVEKPVALSVAQIDELEAAADKAGRLVLAAQNLRFTADFLKVAEVLESGRLGTVFQINIRRHGFRRRWDWQTMSHLGGGMLNNDASHVVDQVLALIDGFTPAVTCTRVRTPLSLGDAEDHVKIVLTAPGRPVVDLELSSACAYPQDQWLIFGTQGSLQGGASRLQWRYIDPLVLEDQAASEEPTPDRSYNTETLPWTEQEAAFSQETYDTSHVRLYRHVHEVLRGTAAPVVTLVDVRRQIALLDACRAAEVTDPTLEVKP